MIKRFAIAVVIILLAVFATVKIFGRPTRFLPENIKSEMESAQLRYFLDQAHPLTGLVRDAALNFATTPDSNRMASMAATGFGLAVIANAASRGMIDPTFAQAYVLKTLTFARDHVERRKGWFFHFADWETGARFDRSEYSTIDTAWFVAGGLYAAQVLQNKEINAIAHQLYADMDFQDFLTDGGTLPDKMTLTMAYLPGEGYNRNQWHMYAEQHLLLLLGLGHPTHPLPAAAWQAWERPIDVLPSGEKLMGLNDALFVHQWSALFVDFRDFKDGHLNYFQNGVVASRDQRNLVKTEDRYKAFQLGFWGLSAGAAPNDSYEFWTPTRHIGMVCIACAVSSAMFMPQDVINDASSWALSPYRDQIWGRYGFTDSLDLERGWFSDHVYGITVGPEFLSLANMNPETSVWKDFMKIPEIKKALERASLSGMPAPQQADSGREPGSVHKKKRKKVRRKATKS